MKTFKQFINEDDGGAIATNNASGGNIAGIGVGPQGEPPGIPAGFFTRRYRKRAYISNMGDAAAGTREVKTQQRKYKKQKRQKEDQQLFAGTGTMPSPTIILARPGPK